MTTTSTEKQGGVEELDEGASELQQNEDLQRGVEEGVGSQQDRSPREKYRCDVCGLMCWSERGKSLHHDTVHTIEGTNRCRFCPRVCENFTKVLEHMAADHPGEEPFRCCLSNDRFFTLAQAEMHLAWKHEDPSLFPANIATNASRLPGSTPTISESSTKWTRPTIFLALSADTVAARPKWWTFIFRNSAI
ncbi:hypothetical protein G7Y89_g6338 [Cudoniella acicularis]|uniref:C2H2-type domain-containing protein n=1 Tax=Cudoniella acicularis TaxID=354080 RepID=A0A8H4W2Y5_9HELO|nr:hypothetical protein G7Y89_g6338 [Cudoniella acicularis]